MQQSLDLDWDDQIQRFYCEQAVSNFRTPFLRVSVGALYTIADLRRYTHEQQAYLCLVSDLILFTYYKHA